MAVFVLGAEKNDFGILAGFHRVARAPVEQVPVADRLLLAIGVGHLKSSLQQVAPVGRLAQVVLQTLEQGRDVGPGSQGKVRSEEHTSELQSLMRISYAVFCLKKTNNNKNKTD